MLNGIIMIRMENINHKLVSSVLIGIIALSFFLIKTENVKSVDVQVSEPSLSVSQNSIQSPPEFSAKNIGKILSIQNGGGYSFIEVKLPSNKSLSLATANLPNEVFVGNDIRWETPRLAKNYYSHTLNKNFERLYMVTIIDESIKQGVVISIKTVEENTLLSVQREHSVQELIVKTERISDELHIGSRVEWQKKIDNRLPQSSIMVDWIRHSIN
jgi:hypothetical protein